MFVIRPAKLEDAESMERLASSDYIGMTSLPLQKNLLVEIIDESIQSFNKQVLFPKDEKYLFVLENLQTGEIGGCCAIYSRSGIEESDFFYRVEKIVQKPSKTLKVAPEMTILHPAAYPHGPTKLCALYMNPNFRKLGLGQLLSRCRFLFIAGFLDRFSDSIVANMRGVIQSDGNCPFWNGLGRHFLNISIKELLALIEKGQYFVLEAMPKYPIYACLLQPETQAAIMQTHEGTRGALKMLLHEGFDYTDKIDGFDGGPILSCATNDISTIKHSKTAKVHAIPAQTLESPLYLISNETIPFRCCAGNLHIEDSERVVLPYEVAYALEVHQHDVIRYSPI